MTDPRLSAARHDAVCSVRASLLIALARHSIYQVSRETDKLLTELARRALEFAEQAGTSDATDWGDS